MGGWTFDVLRDRIDTIFDASEHYARHGVPLVVVAGKMYGSGSSRDWAAKGPALLGVRAVIAESYERIHRSNLIGMGILPLQFKEGEDAKSLGLDGTEGFTVAPIDCSKGLPEPAVDGEGGACGRLVHRVRGCRARGHADRGKVLRERGHSAIRSA